MSIKRNAVAVAGAGLFVLGCGGPPEGPTTAAGAEPTDSAKPKGAATASSTGQAAAPMAAASAAADAPARPAVKSPFFVVADIDYDTEFFPLHNRAFLVVGSSKILDIDGETISFDPLRSDGFQIKNFEMASFGTMGGVWPGAAFLTLTRPTGRTGFSDFYKWNGTKWVSAHASEAGFLVHSIEPFAQGTALALEQASFAVNTRFEVIPSNPKVVVPKATLAKNKDASFCVTQMRAETWKALPSGHVFVAGDLCPLPGDGDAWQVGVERWAPGQSAGTIDILPDAVERDTTALDPVAIAARSGTDVYVGGNLVTRPSASRPPRDDEPYIARFDGAAWKREPTPFKEALRNLVMGSDGVLWATLENGQLWSRPSGGGGAWSKVAMPEVTRSGQPYTVSVFHVWPQGAGDTWAFGAYTTRDGIKSGSTYNVVLRTKEPAKKVVLPRFEDVQDAVEELAMPSPITKWCETPFVLIYTLSKVAPKDYDFPATRAALKGRTEFSGSTFFEFKRVNQRFMGARVQDEKMGKKLVELVTKKVPGSTPQLVCHNPKPTRVLDIDLATGELRASTP